MIELEQVARHFPGAGGETRVLENVTVTIERGDCVVLSGPSGCGKSTLLHLLALQDRPSSGRILWEGDDTGRWQEARCADFRASSLGMIFQQFHLLPHRTVEANVRFRCRYTSQHLGKQEVEALLVRVGLQDRIAHPARLLSGGEQQRLCIARALALQPKLLIADEPTGNLDDANSTMIRGMLAELHAQGQTMIIATHDGAWKPQANRLWTLSAGCLRE